MKISINIVTHNRRDEVIDCLSSLEPILGRDDIECVLVDNDCSDQTVKTVQKRYPSVRTICLHRNLGFTRAANIAAANSTGTVLLQLDDNTELPNVESAVEIIQSRFDEYNDLGILSLQIRDFYDNDQIHDSWGKQHKALTRLVGYHGAGVAIRHSVFEEVNGYPDDYFYFGEEHAMAMKIICSGYDILYDPSVIVYHKKSSQSRQYRSTHYLRTRNRLLTFYSQVPFPLSVRYIARDILNSAKRSRNDGQTINFSKGLLAGISRIPRRDIEVKRYSVDEFDRYRKYPDV